jgi:hypothetical protein
MLTKNKEVGNAMVAGKKLSSITNRTKLSVESWTNDSSGVTTEICGAAYYI